MHLPMMLMLVATYVALYVAMIYASTIGALAALGVAVALLVWFIVTNEWTCRDRQSMVRLYFARPDWTELSLLWDHGPTYHDHMWRRLTLRDPWAIYDPRLRSLLTIGTVS